jgi:hypothetical protein
MPERPDLRAIAQNIQEALADYDREALLEMLTYVFKEYVIDSPPPVLISQVDGIEGLAELSFAQLIETLQTRLDHPELDLFRVSDDQVLVRAGGVLAPLDADGSPSRSPGPLPSEAGQGGAERAAAAEAERRGRGDLTGGRRGVNQAPPPRGVSISGRPTSTGGAQSPSPSPSASEPPPAEPAAPRADDSADKPKPAEGDDDSAVRFSLLELD